ncbi:hypothetical protein AAFF_G00044800 [Aldrovandia affinis]|uniref:Post-SET domain-containing protein n=1 Tax=Aldrovandia affinis TaxID=143900 RepID=A0AAD7R227_9TELE|nr:hypothetical protein AAFF_G00044800 [Aldrovandia affinis]
MSRGSSNNALVKTEGGKRPPGGNTDVMTLSDSDDVQTISSGSEDNKEQERQAQGEGGDAQQGPVKRQVAVKSTRGFALKSTHGLVVKTGRGRRRRREARVAGPGGQREMVAPAGRTPGCFTMARSPVTSSTPSWRATSEAISIIAAVQTCLSRTSKTSFAWVAFFASKRIRAGTELTWDYNYEVGSVEGKELLCCCGSTECRGRLL